MSKLVTAWIDLQNSVNCYIDSDKDPNPLGNADAPSGIRQLLERKEGERGDIYIAPFFDFYTL